MEFPAAASSISASQISADPQSMMHPVTKANPGIFGPGSDIHEAIRQVFDLSPDHILLADMDCKNRPKGKLKGIPGHLYVFNKCLAFNSPKTKSIVIRFSNIRHMKKPSLAKSIIISLEEG